MGKKYEIDVESIIKSKLDEASTKFVESSLKKLSEDRTVNLKVDSDDVIKQNTNIDKAMSASSKKRKKEIQEEASEEIRQAKRVRNSNKSNDIDKVVRTRQKQKDRTWKTREDVTYAEGNSSTFANDSLKSRKREIVNFKKTYGALNKEVTEYYQLKTKIDKGKIAPEDTLKTNDRIKELQSSILDKRDQIERANRRGYENQNLADKAERVYQNARADYENGVEYRKQQAEQKAEKERLSQLKSSHDKQQAENEKWIAELNKSYEQEQKAYTVNQNKMMAEENKKYVQQQKQQTQEVNNLKKIKQQAKEAVSDESITTSNSKRQARLNNYSGQNSTDLTNAKDWSKEIESSQSRLKELISSGASLKTIAAEFDNLSTATKAFESSMSAVEATMEKSLNLSSLDKAKEKIESFEKEYSSFITDTQSKQLNSLKDQYTDGLTASGASSIEKQTNELMEQVKERKKVLTELQNIQKEANNGSFEAQTTTIETTLSKYAGQDSEYINKLRTQAEEIKKYQHEVREALSADNIDASKVSTAYQKLEMATTRYGNALKEVKQVESRTLSSEEISGAANSVQTYMKNNTKALKEYGQQLETLEEKYRNIKTLAQKLDLDKEFSSLKKEISAKGLSGISWFNDLKRAFSQISQFAGMYGIAQNLIQDAPRAVLNAVQEVNASQIELAKVSEASESQLSNYWDQAADSAKKYGATISDVITSTADWSRLGYNLNEAEELSDMTTLIERVGDNMTQESASEGLISVLRGFELQASDAQKIVDVANEIANTQPIDTSGIFSAMQRSASSLKAAGNTYEQGVALATAANSVVQDSDKVGTALKTISMRIRGAETDLESAGLDTDGMATSTAKLREEIKALSGVDIMKNANEFKSTYDILDELSNKWSDLTDIQQANACLYVQKCA